MGLGEFTLGIEEEYQIVDPQTRELKSAISQMMDAKTPLDTVELQGELHEAVVEVATGICRNVDEAREAVIADRRAAAGIAERVGARIAAASTHPIANWQEQSISTDERYKEIVHDLQDVARANLIYGLHVHVGLPDREEAIAVFNQARYFLPHLLALSTSSPFFNGRKSGLKSTRTLIFKRLPRTGIPEAFASYGELERFVSTLVKTGCIDDARRIWWDIRPHPKFSTLEFRICDLPTQVDEVVAIAGLVQAVVAKLTKLKRKNLTFAAHPVAFIEENKWRAARYGVRGQLIDFGQQTQVPFAELVEDLLDFVDDVLDELGARSVVDTVRRIVADGTSADRQLETYERSGQNLEAVVDQILEETMLGVT
ncbi:MAG: carboxylate-amine ligase [Deltaproteobacteria bacterium]|nr:carboxylate-amine ligase [Deltaproteobacteria bacterium]